MTKINFEPAILGIMSFLMYVSSVGVTLALAVISDCGWRGYCNAPIVPFLPLLISHWIIVGFVMEKSVIIARVLLFVFGAIPFLALHVFKNQIQASDQKFIPPIYWYLFIFGFLFTIYLFTSKQVKRYIEGQKNA